MVYLKMSVYSFTFTFRHFLFDVLLVQVVECVGYLHDDLHPCLHGQLLDGGVSLFPERFRVILKGQA